jgi:hypothetical protein
MATLGAILRDCGVRLVREVRLGGEGIWLEKGKCSEEFEMWSGVSRSGGKGEGAEVRLL